MTEQRWTKAYVTPDNLYGEDGEPLAAADDEADFIEVVPATEADRLEKQLADLKAAVKPVLAAHNSGVGRVSEEQITEAWRAFDA